MLELVRNYPLKSLSPLCAARDTCCIFVSFRDISKDI